MSGLHSGLVSGRPQVRVPPVTYGVYPSSFSPALICCEYPPNTMPPVHPAKNGYQGANQTGYLSDISCGPGGTSGAHTTC